MPLLLLILKFIFSLQFYSIYCHISIFAILTHRHVCLKPKTEHNDSTFLHSCQIRPQKCIVKDDRASKRERWATSERELTIITTKLRFGYTKVSIHCVLFTISLLFFFGADTGCLHVYMCYRNFFDSVRWKGSGKGCRFLFFRSFYCMLVCCHQFQVFELCWAVWKTLFCILIVLPNKLI